jgi:hypothetical protein
MISPPEPEEIKIKERMMEQFAGTIEEIKEAAFDYFRLNTCKAKYCVYLPDSDLKYPGVTPLCCLKNCFMADKVIYYLEKINKKTLDKNPPIS